MPESQSGSIWGWRGETSGMGQRIKRVFETGERSDIQFEVGRQYGKEELFQAHKFALSISSDVFDTMFYGSVPQVEKTIKLPDILPQAFRIMLKFLYTDVVEDLSLEIVLPTLYCAQKYGIPMLVDICTEYAIKNVDKTTCLALWESSKDINVEKVVSKCLDIVDIHCGEIFQSDEFLQLNHEILQLIFERDTLRINEEEVYKAAELWASSACRINNLMPTGSNCRRMLGDALFLVRFPLMDDGQLADGPVTTQLLLKEEALKIYQFKHAANKPDIPFSSTPRCRPNIAFCGRQWAVLDQSSIGRGLTAADNVFLDDTGHLHLRLSQHNGVWKGAEIRSADSLGFGLYQFHIEARLDRLDRNVIFAVGSPAGSQSGIDITFAKWGNKSGHRASYGIRCQDSSASSAISRSSNHDFDFSLHGKCTTHLYEWESASVLFNSQYGHQDNSPTNISDDKDFSIWHNDFTKVVIPQDSLPVGIHLSSYLGNGPSNGKEVEIIVHSFRFFPAEQRIQTTI